ncbi:MAG: AfsR/SARP family transcriptional regulator, partial [Acidimicrobiia bacterium]
MDLSSVTVRVLGAVELVDASGEVRDVPGRRLQTLLARLVSQSGQVVSVDALVDAVWPDGLPDSPDAALQTQVFRLRKRLRFPGAPTVATRGPGYALELGSATVDASEFERTVRAAIGAEPSVVRARVH